MRVGNNAAKHHKALRRPNKSKQRINLCTCSLIKLNFKKYFKFPNKFIAL